MSAFEIGLFINNLPIKTGRDGAWMRGEKMKRSVIRLAAVHLLEPNFAKIEKMGKNSAFANRIGKRALFLSKIARLVYPAANLFRNYFSAADNSNHFELIMQCRIRKDCVIIATQ